MTKQPAVYLSGRMNGRLYEEIEKERREAKRELEYLGFAVLDPFEGKEALRGKVLSDDDLDGIHEIVRRDKDMLDRSDAVLVLTGDTPSDGTWMEMGYALYKRNIPVVVIAPQSVAKKRWSNCEAKVVSTLQEAVAVLAFYFASQLRELRETQDALFNYKSHRPVYVVQYYGGTENDGVIDSVWSDPESAYRRRDALCKYWGGKECWVVLRFLLNVNGSYDRIGGEVKA